MCKRPYSFEYLPEDELGPAVVGRWLAMPAPIHDRVLSELSRRYPCQDVRLVRWCECRPADRQVWAVVRRAGLRTPVIVRYSYQLPAWLHLVAEHLRSSITREFRITSINEGTARP